MTSFDDEQQLLYDLKNPGGVLRDADKYGLDFKTLFNLTPLMVAAKLGNVELVNALVERGADPTIIANNGATAFHMALATALNEHMGKTMPKGELFTAKDLTDTLSMLPDSVLPQRRKKQSYISGVLSQNEMTRAHKYNRKLFYRYKRGHYMFNPLLKLKVNNDWIPILELLPFEDIGLHESFDHRFGSYSQYADHWLEIGRKNLEIVKENIFDDIKVMGEAESGSGNAP